MAEANRSIDLIGVTKRYATAASPALDSVNLSLPGRALTTLLGPSGCGKTTLLRLLAGLESADAGRILIDGVDVTRMPAHERAVGLVFQSYALFPHLSVYDNVAFGLRAQQVGIEETAQRAGRVLEMLGLSAVAQRATSSLSGGQQQRVALARALVVEPAVLLFDEPLSNLDAQLRRQVRDDIRGLQQRLRLTVVYVTHDQSEALAVSDTIVVMRAGGVVQIGTPREVYERPANAFVAGFMGDTALFDAELSGSREALLGPLRVPIDAALPQGTSVTLAVRPDAWQLRPACVAGLPARVLRSTYLGVRQELLLSTPLGELFVLVAHATPRYQVGAPLSLTLGRRGVSVLR